MIKITLASVFVDDQEKALRFYTEVVGFTKRTDLRVGDAWWLTVGSPASDDIELVLEPSDNSIAREFQEGTYRQGIPATTFAADDVRREHDRMTALGVVFSVEPVESDGVISAVFDDTCGNYIGLHQLTRR